MDKRNEIRPSVPLSFFLFMLMTTFPARADINPALFKAVSRGNVARVLTLVDNGVDVNVKDKDGNTALMYAAKNGNMDVVQILLDRGAKAQILNARGETALAWAVGNGHIDSVKALFKGQGWGNGLDGGGSWV
jgi:ankyrin repeat protein